MASSELTPDVSSDHDPDSRIEMDVSDGLETSDAKTSTVEELVSLEQHDDRRRHPDRYVYIFRDGHSLSSLFDKFNQIDVQSTSWMRHLRLRILYPVRAVALTPVEENGGIDGPNMGPLVESWRSAFQKLPKEHSIQEIQFDMGCETQTIEPREIVRLLQHISTLVNVKSHRLIRCSARGCQSEEKRLWLEKSMVGANRV